MIDSRLPQYDPRDQVSFDDLSNPVTFFVDCHSGDTLFLFGNFVFDAATRLSFTFENAGIYDPDELYKELLVNYGTGAAVVRPIYVDTGSDDLNFKLPVSLTGVGVTSGRVKVTVTATAGSTNDLLVITPVVGRLG